MAITKEYLERMPAKEKKGLYQSFFGASLFSEGGFRERQKRQLRHLAAIFDFTPEEVEELESEVRASHQRISTFIDEFVREHA